MKLFCNHNHFLMRLHWVVNIAYFSIFNIKNFVVNAMSFEDLFDTGLLGVGDEDLPEIVAAC